ncbi:hypothetical protein HK100_000286 [Physocladia obscura]|uniref:Thioredoxin domain-containing protein n=1 Tax=Physocladia obscura TaxID=109957 RepID=A0AAD5T4M9_9FUNG|nr:hypothetical protein HK100_000286 [Physocladia obscura]
MATHKLVLLPGQTFPDLTVTLTTGEQEVVKSDGKNAKLIVVYRGAFCPFCNATAEELKKGLPKLKENGIDVIMLSADLLDVAKKFVADHSLDFPVGHSLDEAQLKTLSTYVSSPTNYIEQKQIFSEPAWFLLEANNKIKYVEYGSTSFSARPNIDKLLAGYNYSKKRAQEYPEFGKVVFGSYNL